MKMVDVDFRVWDREQGRYIDVDFVEGCFLGIEVHKRGALPFIRNCDEAPSSMSFFNNCDIEFFTGIIDGDGNKIFDGDVVAHINHRGGIEYHSVIRYVPGLATFFAEGIERPVKKPLCEVVDCYTGVIGTIHDQDIQRS